MILCRKYSFKEFEILDKSIKLLFDSHKINTKYKSKDKNDTKNKAIDKFGSTML